MGEDQHRRPAERGDDARPVDGELHVLVDDRGAGPDRTRASGSGTMESVVRSGSGGGEWSSSTRRRSVAARAERGEGLGQLAGVGQAVGGVLGEQPGDEVGQGRGDVGAAGAERRRRARAGGPASSTPGSGATPCRTAARRPAGRTGCSRGCTGRPGCRRGGRRSTARGPCSRACPWSGRRG